MAEEERQQFASGTNCNTSLKTDFFNEQLNKVKTQTTAAGKKIVAMRIATDYCLSAQQVFELCSALPLNNDKLELAKFSYKHCVDPQNFEAVYNSFSISSYVTQLDDYIKAHPVLPTHIETNATNQQDEIIYVHGYNGPLGCPAPMSRQTFEDAANTIKAADFENTRIETAKTIIKGNCMTVDQVMTICKMFDFENTKLEFAKFAYSKTYDKGNYFKVTTVFDYDASKNELNRFISK